MLTLKFAESCMLAIVRALVAASHKRVADAADDSLHAQAPQ